MTQYVNQSIADTSFTTAFLHYVTRNLHHTQIQVAKDNMIVAESIRPLIEEFYLKVAPSFIVVLSCRRISPYNFYMSVLQHLIRTVDNMILQLVVVNHRNPQRIEGSRRYNLLLVDSYQAFLDIDVISYTKDYDINEYYHIFLMHFDNRLDRDMQKIFDYCWKNQIINCNVQYQNTQKEIMMFTYFPYTPTSCGTSESQLINQFVNGTWLNQPYFKRKLKNFHGCPLTAMVRQVKPLAFRNKNNASVFQGCEVEMFMELADLLNFTLIFHESADDDRWWPNTENSGLDMLEMQKQS